MKRKIFISLFVLFLITAAGAVTATLYIRTTTDTLSQLIKRHQIEALRKSLIMSVQTVQSNLYNVEGARTTGYEIDTVTTNMLKLRAAAEKCTSCHSQHSADVITGIGLLLTDLDQFETQLSHYMTLATVNTAYLNSVKLNAAEIGNRLLMRSEGMSHKATERLEATTAAAMMRIDSAQTVLYASLFVSLGLGAAIALYLTRSITRPVDELVRATRALASGNLDHAVTLQDKTEFGELANHFNNMSRALRESYDSLKQEISERRETEKALSLSEAFLNTIFDSIRDPFCIVDRQFRIVRANDAYAEMKNKGIGTLPGKVCYEFLEGKTGVCKDCVVEKTFLSGDTCAKEKQTNAPDGSPLWLAIYTYPIQDSTGAVSHVIEYVQDITSRKLAEEALRESEERYALAARGANDGLWDWNIRTNRIHLSYRWKTMLGYSESELGDSPEEWLGRVHADDREDVEAKIASHLRGQNPHLQVEHRMRHKNGTYHWMLNRGLAIRDKEGIVVRMAGSQTDITDRKNAEEQLLHDAFHDALTGLPNRALFLDRLQHVIQATPRHGSNRYAVLFIDLDRFKVINDSLGHSVGDLLLIEVGKRLNTCLRPGDTVARLGGDEFAVLLNRINDLTDAADVTERILRGLTPSFFIQGHEVYVTSSIGIALSSDRYANSEQVLRDADIAMYQAKAKGKARFEFFDTSMHAGILDRLQLEADLRVAVERRQDFVLHYQPIVNISTQGLVGFEALVRWNHPDRGMIPPGEFIPLAEETGMIVRLSEWILQEGCRQLKEWQTSRGNNNGAPLKMSLNVSSRHFLQPRFADHLANIITETGLSKGSLALEITESVIMANTELAVKTMVSLRDMGVHIHIDDFGTGYSSLSYLHHFPVNALKIDRSFICKMATSEENREIVKTIVSLAQSLGLDVIAEGVELDDQLCAVKDLSCEYGQGFLFAKPMSSTDVAAWLKEGAPIKGTASAHD